MSKLTTVSRLRVGQRFTWVPAQWFGAGRLLSKKLRVEYSSTGWPIVRTKRRYFYDLKYDAAVVNPPAVDYGVPGDTKVRILKKGERVMRHGMAMLMVVLLATVAWAREPVRREFGNKGEVGHSVLGQTPQEFAKSSQIDVYEVDNIVRADHDSGAVFFFSYRDKQGKVYQLNRLWSIWVPIRECDSGLTHGYVQRLTDTYGNPVNGFDPVLGETWVWEDKNTKVVFGRCRLRIMAKDLVRAQGIKERL